MGTHDNCHVFIQATVAGERDLSFSFFLREQERDDKTETVQMMTFTKSWHHWPDEVSGTHLPPEATVPPATTATPREAPSGPAILPPT